MTVALKEFVQREPRYIIRPEDREVVRYASSEDSKKSFSTSIINISSTGMAFSIHREDHPEIDELIMVEFTVPGSEQMACYARVIRIESVHKGNDANPADEVIVGVRFCKLRQPHIKNLNQGLELKFKQLERQQKLRKWSHGWSKNWNWILTKKQTIFITCFALAVIAYMFYAMYTPSAKQSPIHKIPWSSKKSN